MLLVVFYTQPEDQYDRVDITDEPIIERSKKIIEEQAGIEEDERDPQTSFPIEFPFICRHDITVCRTYQIYTARIHPVRSRCWGSLSCPTFRIHAR